MKRLLVAACCILLTACAAPLLSVSPTPSPSATPAPTPSPSPIPSPAIVCVRQVLPTSALDPCPTAIAAVDAAVAPLDLPIARVTLIPGVSPCGEIWPGADNTLVCLPAFVPTGEWMHGWVGFAGSPKVAAVNLSRPSPVPPRASPSPSPWPWRAAMSAFQVPPTGWTFPVGPI